ncbi:kelch-like protein 2 [Paramacrobiotus metropolitanus]|uniref:kelch-like protein 2 n=1 Tax=Paramacrobiotus metropolitanus TaxID=2943436 RepID=UPI002445A390|nr:kelch-like protein 2 [Paramacrobiotus metropolitanus]XP_055345792.1 kelch-like protein 2 [Paramacrobiotus metropolitanus]
MSLLEGDPKRAHARDLPDAIGETGKHSSQNASLEDAPYSFVNLQHPSSILRGLYGLKASGAFCDVILHGSDAVPGSMGVSCHRLVLSACSSYFRGMFTSKMDEASKDEIQLQNITGCTLKDVINYAYSSEICIDKNNVQSLLAAATFLDIGPIRDACCSFLERNMDETNCLMMHCFAELHSCTMLAEKAKNFALQRFAAVSQCAEFLEMVKDKVIDLIGSDDLNVEREETVFDAVVHWLLHDPIPRTPQFAEILQYVRLPLLSPYYLEDIVAPLSAIQDNPAAQDLLREARYFHELPNRRIEWTSSRCRLRKSFGFAEVIVCVGGEDDKVVLRSVECFNPLNSQWCHLKSLPQAVSKAGLVITGENFMYLCGGEFPDGSAVRQVYRYDPILDEWRDMAPLQQARSEVGVALVDDHIYAIGGYDRVRRLETVERYDPHANRWQNVANLRTPLSNCAVVAYRSYLYIFGGVISSESYESTNYAFRYDPKNNMWSDLARMPTNRSGCAACVGPSGLIYVIGGIVSGQETLNRVDAYDPSTNQWIKKCDMNTKRYRPGVSVLDNKIYVLGGEKYLDNHSSEIEFYDEAADTWTVHKSELPCSRSWLSCVVMRIKKGDPNDPPTRTSRDNRIGWSRP